VKQLLSFFFSLSLIVPQAWAKPVSYEKRQIQAAFHFLKTTHGLLRYAEAASVSQEDKEFFKALREKSTNQKLPKVLKAGPNYLQLSNMDGPLKITGKNKLSYMGKTWTLESGKGLASQIMQMYQAVYDNSEKSAALSFFPKAHAKESQLVKLANKHMKKILVLATSVLAINVGLAVIKRTSFFNITGTLIGGGIAALGALGILAVVSGDVKAEEVNDGQLHEIGCPSKKDPVTINLSKPDGTPYSAKVHLDEQGKPINLMLVEGNKEHSRCFLRESGFTKSWSVQGKCRGQQIGKEDQETLLTAMHAVKRTCSVSRKTIENTNAQLAKMVAKSSKKSTKSYQKGQK
jgi:hypothetical protein